MATTLTGIKPSGMPHLGNYLGAIQPALGLAEQHRAFYFIADYHALTTQTDRAAMNESIYQVAATWLACGLDPEKVFFYRQSDVPQVFELAWALGCVCPKGQMDRAHAYKDAVEKGRSINIGTYTYPVLMAADIILFDAHLVPVGKDQKQHVEIARDLAQKFNHIFGGEILVPPEPMIDEQVMTVPGIDGRKMSKSYGNEIGLLIPKKKLRKRVMKIVTDSTTVEEPKDPDSAVVFKIFQAIATPEQQADLAQRLRAGGMGWGHAKQELYEVLEARFAPMRGEYERLMNSRDHLDAVLARGAERAGVVADATMDRVRRAIGMR